MAHDHNLEIWFALDGSPSKLHCSGCGVTWRVGDGEPVNENPSYGPGNPDWERDREHETSDG